MKKNHVMKVQDITLSVFCMLFFLSLAVIGTFHFRVLYYLDIEYLDIVQRSGLSEEVIRKNYDAVIDYYGIGADKDLILPTLPMSEEAAIHFWEVRNIVYFVYVTAAVAFVGACFGAYYKIRKKNPVFLKYTVILNITVPLLLGIAAFFFWNSFFVLFHKVMFRNDYWIFDPIKDPIILMLPDTFFLHCLLLIGFFILLSSVICGCAYVFLVKKFKFLDAKEDALTYSHTKHSHRR